MKRYLRRICLLSAVLLVLSLLLPGVFASAPAALAAGEVELTILHTNDVHARAGVEPYAVALKKQYQGEGKNVLLLSAGDVLHGQPIATLQRGDSIVEIMNKAEYDAMAPGNHDFNYGYERLLELEGKMNFAVLGANVQLKSNNTNIFKNQYLVKEYEGVKVGIFGLATPETVTKTNPMNVQGLDFQDPTTVAKQMVTELRDNQKCDVVIALVHLGLDEATVPAERSTAVAAVEGIDLVVDGHSHTKLESGKTDAGAPIVEAYQYGQSIGEVTLSVAADKKVSVDEVKLHNSSDKNTPKFDWEADKDVADIIAAMNKANEPVLSRVVAHTDHTLYGGTEYTRNAETNLANLITDAMLAKSGADVALTNGGGIRSVIPAGDITVDQIITVLPFGNFIVTREVTGANIKSAIEFGISDYPNRAGKFPQIAGLKVVFDPDKPVGSRVLSATLADGSPLQDSKVYTLATNDFMAVGGDGYTMLNTGGFMAYSALDEALIDYLATNPAIKAGPEGRLSTAPAQTEQPTPPAQKTGWEKDGDAWRYYGEGGIPVTGWLMDGSNWYYFNKEAKMHNGWRQIEGMWYYFGAGGAMATNWQQIGGQWYYLRENGSMAKGWVSSGGKWYYMKYNGAMATGWVQDGEAWFYLNHPGGDMVTGTKTIGGKSYRFANNGEWVK